MSFNRNTRTKIQPTTIIIGIRRRLQGLPFELGVISHSALLVENRARRELHIVELTIRGLKPIIVVTRITKCVCYANNTYDMMGFTWAKDRAEHHLEFEHSIGALGIGQMMQKCFDRGGEYSLSLLDPSRRHICHEAQKCAIKVLRHLFASRQLDSQTT